MDSSIEILQNKTKDMYKYGKFKEVQKMFEAFIETLESEKIVDLKERTAVLALAYNDLGHSRYMQVCFDEAIEDYTQAISLAPDLSVAFYNRGTIHYRLANFKTAVEDLSQACKLNPNNPEYQEGYRNARANLDMPSGS